MIVRGKNGKSGFIADLRPIFVKLIGMIIKLTHYLHAVFRYESFSKELIRNNPHFQSFPRTIKFN